MGLWCCHFWDCHPKERQYLLSSAWPETFSNGKQCEVNIEDILFQIYFIKILKCRQYKVEKNRWTRMKGKAELSSVGHLLLSQTADYTSLLWRSLYPPNPSPQEPASCVLLWYLAKPYVLKGWWQITRAFHIKSSKPIWGVTAISAHCMLWGFTQDQQRL